MFPLSVVGALLFMGSAHVAPFDEQRCLESSDSELPMILAAGMPTALPAASAIQFAQEESRIGRCLGCCAKEETKCIEREGETRRCTLDYENCITTCRSQGETPSNWGPTCWRGAAPQRK